MSPPTLCFDMYGTLCDTSSITAHLGEVLDIAEEFATTIDRLWRRKQLQYAYQRGQMDAYQPFWSVTDDALAYALGFYDISIDDRDEILDAYNRLDPFPDAITALDTLGDMGYERVILSNGTPDMLETLAENAGLTQYVEDIISAHEVRTFKPAPAVYENAATRLDREIETCQLVSSNAWDIAGAGNAGMQTAWVNRTRSPPERLDERADLEVRTLDELPTALASS